MSVYHQIAFSFVFQANYHATLDITSRQCPRQSFSAYQNDIHGSIDEKCALRGKNPVTNLPILTIDATD